MSLPANEFPADEEKAIAAFIEDLDGGGGNLVLDPWMLTEVVPKAMARIVDTHTLDAAGACAVCGRRPCPLRQTALAYTRGLVADGADYHVLARSAVRGVARVPEAPVETGWLRRPPAGGSTS